MIGSVITGMGVITAIGNDVGSFKNALQGGRSNFDYITRQAGASQKTYVGAPLTDYSYLKHLKKHHDSPLLNRCQQLRNATISTELAVLTTLQAWQDALLGTDQDHKITLIVAGSNFNQQIAQQVYQRYQDKLDFVRPSFGSTFLDTDIVGALSEIFQIKQEGYTLGGASASGNLGIIHGVRHIQHQEADIVVVVGGYMDLSVFEYQGLAGLGAMGGERFFDSPAQACRPFDKDRDGFIYGEGCGCVILESRQNAQQRGAKIHGSIAGYGVCLDGNRGPQPSQAGETHVMQKALQMADIEAKQIDYINPHGTASKLGDETETAAIKAAGLQHAKINATKSLTGHTLSAAGVIECIATLIQMNGDFYHPTKNLEQPISEMLQWVMEDSQPANIHYALSNSFGFGGINSSIILRKEV